MELASPKTVTLMLDLAKGFSASIYSAQLLQLICKNWLQRGNGWQVLIIGQQVKNSPIKMIPLVGVLTKICCP
jgi:hypothetical protein